jgi:multicomponent K+:H+ antiporter subunit D
MNHLPVLPIVLPLLAGALLLLIERAGLTAQRALAAVAMLLQLGVAWLLLQSAATGEVSIYLLGDWPAQIGISLALDRLSALMVATTAVLGSAALLYAGSGWDSRALHFHALFQFQLAGLNGAFLTADLFNLFVFFEVLLIASYGLLLSGGRGPRVRVGFQYVVFNVTASTLFLVALGLLYGLLGVLNMHEMGARIAAAPAEQHGLILAAGGILLVVFGAKAALLPMYLWLPQTYARSPAPVAALFAIMTKLGIYAILRVYTLLYGEDAGPLAGWAADWLLPAGAIALVLASLGAFAATSLRGLAAYLVVGSAATLFIVLGLDAPASTGPGLYYLVHSTFAAAALFLLADLIRRRRGSAGDSLKALVPVPNRGLFGALYLLIAVSLVGLPPLSGFVGKFTLLASMENAQAAWLWPLILVCSLLTLIAMARAGSRLFWKSGSVHGDEDTDAEEAAAGPARVELAAVGALVVLGIGMSLFANPLLRYGREAAQQVHSTQDYRRAVEAAAPRLRSTTPLAPAAQEAP